MTELSYLVGFGLEIQQGLLSASCELRPQRIAEIERLQIHLFADYGSRPTTAVGSEEGALAWSAATNYQERNQLIGC